MPRFYFEFKNILHRILLNVCVRVRGKKNKQTETDERKKFIYLFIYFFVYASPFREIIIQVYR